MCSMTVLESRRCAADSSSSIRSNVALGEAQYKAQSIFDYAPSSNGADDYRERHDIINSERLL